FAGAVGAFVWADSPPADAAFVATPGSAAIAIAAVVAGAPETVVFSGPAKINTVAVTDPDFGGPTNVVIPFDLRGMSGKGTNTSAAYVIPTELIVVRPLAVADTVDFTFPFFPSGAAPTAPGRLAKATAALVYNPATGALTAAAVAVTAP